MIYQLPTGKIIYITVEQYLTLSDDELGLLISAATCQNVGEYARSPWEGSILKKPKKKNFKEEQEEHDSSIDYTEDSEELCIEKPVFADEVLLENIPEPPEENEEDVQID